MHLHDVRNVADEVPTLVRNHRRKNTSYTTAPQAPPALGRQSHGVGMRRCCFFVCQMSAAQGCAPAWQNRHHWHSIMEGSSWSVSPTAYWSYPASDISIPVKVSLADVSIQHETCCIRNCMTCTFMVPVPTRISNDRTKNCRSLRVQMIEQLQCTTGQQGGTTATIYRQMIALGRWRHMVQRQGCKVM